MNTHLRYTTAVIACALLLTANTNSLYKLEKLGRGLKEIAAVPQQDIAERIKALHNQQKYTEIRQATTERIDEILDHIFSGNDTELADAFINAWPEKYPTFNEAYVRHKPTTGTPGNTYQQRWLYVRQKHRLWFHLFYKNNPTHSPQEITRIVAKTLHDHAEQAGDSGIHTMRVREETLAHAAAQRGMYAYIITLHALVNDGVLKAVPIARDDDTRGTSAIIHVLAEKHTKENTDVYQKTFSALLQYCAATHQPLLYSTHDTIFTQDQSNHVQKDLASMLTYGLCTGGIKLERSQAATPNSHPARGAEENWTCYICKKHNEHEKTVTLKLCKDTFHETCIQQWLELGGQKCPKCRQILPERIMTQKEARMLNHSLKQLLQHFQATISNVAELCQHQIPHLDQEHSIFQNTSLVYSIIADDTAYASAYLNDLLSSCSVQAKQTARTAINQRRSELEEKKQQLERGVQQAQLHIESAMTQRELTSGDTGNIKSHLENRIAHINANIQWLLQLRRTLQ